VSQQPQEVKTPFLVGAAVLGCTALYVAWLLFLGVLLLLGNAFGAVDTVFIASGDLRDDPRHRTLLLLESCSKEAG
jgi:hypothetical protein